MSIGLRHLPRLFRRLFNEGSLPQQVAGTGVLASAAVPVATAAWGWGEPHTWLAMALTGLAATAAATWVAWRASAALLRVSDAAQSLRSEHLRDGLDVPLLNASAELFVLSARLRRLVLAVRRHRKELEALNHALGQRLHARTHELSTLQELSIGLAQQTDLHHLVDEALQALERTLSYSSASLWAREDLRAEGRVVLMGYRTGEGHEGLDGDDLSGMRLSRGNLRHYERIERERQTVVDNQVQHSFLSWLIDRVTDDARTSTLYRNSRSWVAQPLQFRDDVLGVMRVDHAEPGYFDPERVRLLQAVSSQAALAMHHAQLAEQARDLAVMAERNRIARDLHDAVSQTLFAAHVIAGTLGKALRAGADEALSQQAQSLGQLIQGALAEMRMLMLELRPDALEKMTFGELLKHAIDAQSSRGGTRFVRHVASADRLSAPVRMQLYRIAQEALSNVSRHSGATEAEVQWVVQGPKRAMLRIRDNGCGFDTTAEHPGHFGLENMRARAEEIGAVLTVVSAPGQGTDLTVQWGDPPRRQLTMPTDTHTPAIRVFLADDHPMVRAGLAGMIQGEGGLTLAGEAADGREAVKLIPTVRPDVVLLDMAMPHLDGVGVIEALHASLPDTRFVILSSLLDPLQVDRAVRAGARGYLLKTASAQELVTMIRQVHAGRRVLGPEITDALIANQQRDVPGADLTTRERQLLALMVQGMSNQEIAEAMGIALPTVKYHVTNVLGKLQVDSRTEAVVLALKHKLVPQG